MNDYRIQRVVQINQSFQAWDDFYIQLQFDVGKSGAAGAESFLVSVASPKKLESLVAAEEGGVYEARGLLVMNDFSDARLRLWLDRFVSRLNVQDWDELVNSLSQYFEPI